MNLYNKKFYFRNIMLSVQLTKNLCTQLIHTCFRKSKAKVYITEILFISSTNIKYICLRIASLRYKN